MKTGMEFEDRKAPLQDRPGKVQPVAIAEKGLLSPPVWGFLITRGPQSNPFPVLHLSPPPAFLMGMAARQVFYKGKVQGVGFRYSVKRIAGGFEVVGWVKNLPDGRVELQAMSHDPEELEAFLEEIENSSLGGNIKNVESHDIPDLTGVRGFSITH
jgi:acylphosphatase